MKGGTVQISWHGSDPILSLDFHLSTGLLATAGADRDIKLWSLHRVEKSKALPSVTFKANLSYHNAAVNVLRFSPSGELLASGSDNGELLIWRLIQLDGEIPSWKVWKTLCYDSGEAASFWTYKCRQEDYHRKDVLDLGWSPDGEFLVSGSVDNTCIIWNVAKGAVEQVLADHQHYVQGVTWDPLGKYVASLSGDRTCRIYSMQPPTKRSKSKEKNAKRVYACQHVLCRKDAVATTVDVGEPPQKQMPSLKPYLFYDENMPSFFRRLSWSPDGSFLLVPSGMEKDSPEAAPYGVSYIVSRNDLSRPVLQLPAASKPVVATRFCPVIFSLCPTKSWKHDTNVPGVGAFKLPYRLVFAVATLNSVFIYDTEQSCPIAIFGGLHYAPITDLAWSFDAKFLAISSQDGYCTLVGFDEGDLGTPMPLADLSPNIPSLLLDSRLANTQSNCSTLSPLKDSSEKGVYSSSGPAELVQKMAVPEEDPAIGTDYAPVLSTEKRHKKQSDSQVRPQKIRRINPKPISEVQHKPTVSTIDASLPAVNSGGLDLKECLSSDARCCQNTAEVPLEVSEAHVLQLGLVRGMVNGKKRLGVVQAPSGASNSRSEQGSIHACQAVVMEGSAFLQSCLTTDEVNPAICTDAESDRNVGLSRKDQQGLAESAQGPTTPLCQEHGIGLGFNPLNSQKPRDQYSDIYVRPLKFRRISPNLIPDDLDKPDALKPLPTETSLVSLNGLQSI